MYNQIMSKRYRTFKNRITIAFIIVFLIFGFYNLIYTYNSTRREVKKFTLASIKNSSENITNSMVDFISSNNEIIDIVKSDDKNNNEKRFENTQKLYNITSTLISTMPMKMPIHIIDKDKVSRYSSTNYYKPIYKDVYSDFYKSLEDDENRVHQKVYRRFDSELHQDIVLVLGKAIVDKNKKVVGYVVIEILEKYFNQYIDDVTFFKDSNIYVTDINNKIIVDRNHIENVGKNLNDVINKKDKIYYSSKDIKKFNVISTIPKKDLYYELLSNIKVFLILILIVIILGIIIIYNLSKRISNPVHEMSEVIKQIEDGNRNIKVKYSGDDELGELCDKFNSMIQEINRLIEEDYNKRILINQAKFNALKAQINPHFLYNALGTINWMVKLGEKDKVTKMINALSKLFRYLCRNSEDEVLIVEELKAIDNYLYIQKIRYEDKLNIEYLIDDEIKNYEIVRLTLQPIVENAIVHGLSNKSGEWKIIISGKIEGSDIVFKIKDNGVGVGNSKHTGEGVGIDNVDTRIKIQYGEKYGISHKSEENLTVFIIRIPLREAVNEKSSFS